VTERRVSEGIVQCVCSEVRECIAPLSVRAWETSSQSRARNSADTIRVLRNAADRCTARLAVLLRKSADGRKHKVRHRAVGVDGRRAWEERGGPHDS
jgi:hypothetical protein